MKNINPFGVSMPAAGRVRALHAATARSAHAGIAAQRKRRTAAATDASVDGGFL